MKKKTLLHFWLLLCLMVAGATNAWADDPVVSTLKFNAACGGSGTASDGAAWAVTSDGTESSFDGTKGIHYGTGSAQVTYIKLSTSDISGTITKVVVNASTASGVSATVSVTVGGSAFGGDAQTLTSSAADYTFMGSASGEIIVTVTKPSKAAKALYVKSIAVTYSNGGGAQLETSDLALTDAPIALNFDLYNNSSAQVINYTTSSTGEVTIAESDYANFAIDEENQTITVTPTAVTPQAQNITVNQAADATYKAGSVTFTVTVTDSTPIPTHTATFSVNGETSTEEFEEGADIEFPENPEAIDGKVFVGWSSIAIDGLTDDAPEFVTEATMGESDVTFYAVFAESSVSTDVVADSLSLGFTGVTGTTYSGWSEKKATSGAVYAGNSAGGNSAIQLRSNNGTSGIVSTTSGGRISKVFVKWNSNTADKRTLDVYGSNTAYSSASDLYDINKYGKKLGSIVNGTSTELAISDTCNYAYVGVRSNSGAMYLDSIAFTWGGGTTYSDYCTTVAADTREEAGISFAEASVTKEIVENYTGQALANPNGLVGITWKSSNKAVATVDENGALTVLAIGETIITASFDGNEDYKKATVSYTLTIQDSRKAIELAFAEESVNVNVNETVEAPELTGNTGGASVSYKSDDDDIATVDENGIVTGVADGTTTITATVEATNEYKGGTATFTVTVIDPTKPGSLSNPYTVEQAIYAIDNDGDVTDVYAKGVVSKIVTALNATYGNITYDISDDGKTSGKQLRAYRGKSYDGAKFKSAAELQVGDTVVIRGDLLYYSSGKVYEFNQDNQLVSLVRNFELNEDDGYEGTVEVTGHISIDRTIKAGTWSTIVLPYTMDELPSFITVKKFTGSTYADGCVTLNFDNATSIEANVPCMFKSDYAFSNIKPAEDKAVVVYPASELQNVETEYADMIATYAAIEELPEGVFFISNNKWYEVAENQAAHMKAFRAYFELHDIPAEARIMAIGLENEATEIKAIENGQLVIGNGAVYDLQGRRVEKPARGLYIVNGKKVLVK